MNAQCQLDSSVNVSFHKVVFYTQAFRKMRILLLLCTVALAGVPVHSSKSAKDFLSRLKAPVKFYQGFDRDNTKPCHADISFSHLKWMGIELANANTNDTARSYYENFKRTVSRGRNISKFQVGIEYKSPKIIPTSDRKIVTVDWYNLLFTSSLLVQKKSNQKCRSKSYLGFVELIQTDTTWYKYNDIGVEHNEWNLGKHPKFQGYVITKPSQQTKYIFADGKPVPLSPVDYDRIVSLKYESGENITIDFKQHPETLEYEKLVEKKIFMVHLDPSGHVFKVIAGVDVMMYLHYHTYNVTDAVHLSLNKNQSLIQWIVDADRYIGVLNDDTNHKFRDRQLKYEAIFHNPSTTTLNPLLNDQHIAY